MNSALKSARCPVLVVLALIALSSVSTSRALSTGGGESIQIIGRDWQAGANGHGVSPGHVFMVIRLETNLGIKEEPFGFYPRRGGLGVIKGPGMLRSEFSCGANDDCDPQNYSKFLKRFSEATDSVTIQITDSQRKEIYREINAWDGKEYRLTNENCIDFIVSVVKALGYAAPEHHSLQSPTSFVRSLKGQIEIEKEQIEKEQAEKLYIPPGWVRCACPSQHAPFGKWVRGALYHPNTIKCRQ